MCRYPQKPLNIRDLGNKWILKAPNLCTNIWLSICYQSFPIIWRWLQIEKLKWSKSKMPWFGKTTKNEQNLTPLFKSGGTIWLNIWNWPFKKSSPKNSFRPPKRPKSLTLHQLCIKLANRDRSRRRTCRTWVYPPNSHLFDPSVSVCLSLFCD